MPNVTVKLIGGKDKENLTAFTIGNKLWGDKAKPWGSTQSVPSGDTLAIDTYYSSKKYSVGTCVFSSSNYTIELTADGPDETVVQFV